MSEALVLPPLDLVEPHSSPAERAVNLLAVVLLHAVLAYALLFFSVKNELIALPSSISVRLLPMIEEPPATAKPLPPPPPKAPVRKPPPVQPQPVLAVPAPGGPQQLYRGPATAGSPGAAARRTTGAGTGRRGGRALRCRLPA